MWHAAQVLGFQADTLDPKHVAMVAATYFSMPADDLVDELTKANEVARGRDRSAVRASGHEELNLGLRPGRPTIYR